MKLTGSQVIVLSLLAITVVLLGLVAGIAADRIPACLNPYVSRCWPLLGILVFVLIVLRILQARGAPPSVPAPGDPLLVQIVPEPPKEEPKPHIPVPPTPYFAHPYPMQPNFTGRVAEREMLTGWLTDGNDPVFALTAIGGIGKSALTWAWLQRDVLGFPLPGSADDPSEVGDACRVPEDARPEGVLWWSFYERESTFEAFVAKALSYVSGGSINPADIRSTYERMEALMALLQQRRFLLVLDGFERELRAYASLSAAYQGDADPKDEPGNLCACTDPHAGQLLQWLAAGPIKSRVLLTSRLFPGELEELAGCRREDLDSMDPEHAVTFFRAQGVEKGTRAEIQTACAAYGYHPLALRLLAGVIVADKRNPGDVRVAERYPVLPELKGKEQHHILQVAYDTLDKPKRGLLSRIAAFRSPMTYETLLIFNPYKSEEKFEAALDELMDRGLLFLDPEQRRYDLHPIVRQHAYERLADKKGVHTRLRDYFADVPTPGEEKIESVEDLNPVIELYHHTVRAGRYDEAFDLLRDRLTDALYFRFGAYQTCIELLRALFPDDEDRPPRLKDEAAQACTLNTLANSYSLSGQPRRAVPLFEPQNVLLEKADDKKNLAIGLGNVAYMAQLPLGELAAAEANLRRSIELCAEIEDKGREATSRYELGRLLAYEAKCEEADEELTSAFQAKQHHAQAQGIIWAYRALRALLMGDAGAALKAARRAHQIATSRQNEGDRIRAEWLLGWSLVVLACEGKSGQDKRLTGAETHLTEALTRCRRINLVEVEPDILVAWARWHRIKDNVPQSREHAEEALSIADRCEYRLVQADCHNFLARLDLEAGDRKSAVKHARTAYERAWCDAPPHCYKPALDEAEELLRELGEAVPRIS